MNTEKLVIVESPTKAKTIHNILGEEYSVFSCMGHIIDLPKNSLGITIDKDFQVHYTVIPQRRKILQDLIKQVKNKRDIYIATDPDREGEAIGWHIKNKLPQDKNYWRVVFHEITPMAIKEAFANLKGFDNNMIEAQMARRTLDRLVGYFLSPLLWKKVVRGLSAGRVQSVALRLIVEREREILAFKPQEYWKIEAELTKEGEGNKSFISRLNKYEGKKIEIRNKQEAEEIIKQIKDKQFKVKEIKEVLKKKSPSPPFTTSSLQQEAFNRLHFSISKTMLIAQQLYEGIEIGEKGAVGLITYMRTDSTRISEEAKKQVKDYILSYYGERYLGKGLYPQKKSFLIQAAHEAIRPTSLERTPESIKNFLNQDQYKLYTLIYNRFLASQMSALEYKVTTVFIKVDKYEFVASGTTVIFDGFTVLYPQEQEKVGLPYLEKNEVLQLLKLIPHQYFTNPPARFSEGSLVKLMEQEGIGRPSTYAPTIQTLISRNYVRRSKGYLYPTELGFKVCDLLIQYFPHIMDIKFTARMEEELDKIEEGRIDRLKVLREFYASFKKELDFAQQNIKKEVVLSEENCDKCGKPMVIKWGRKGKFLSCSGYPDCKNSKTITTGIKCPELECTGELVERRSRKGIFYGCSRYPQCKFTSKELPSKPNIE
ncbi:MAG: type I DNA topoisomerase [Candidatus Omnitrophica bacterium]|nr:type I DNA topoisomerase [Candidatus Omnitrophota bacterium]